MTRIGQLIVQGLAAGASLIRPSAFQPIETENAFAQAQGHRYTAQRRVGVFLALAIWVTYFASDIFDVYRGPSPDAGLREVLELRGLGAIVLAVGSLFSLGRWFQNNRRAQALILPVFMLLFIVVMRISAIQGTSIAGSSDDGLMVTLLFLVAFFRLKSTVATAVLVASLTFRILMFPIFAMPTASYFVDIRNFDVVRYVSIIGQPLLFFSFFDMFCFVLAGSVIAAELERGDRAAFRRELELADANLDLLESRRDADAKAMALVAAKEDLLALATQSSRDKSKFLADAAHDLAQPIHAVSLLIEAARLALARTDIPSTNALIRDAGRAAQVARSSFKAVLDVSQLETGLVEPVYSVFEVNDLVEEVVLSLGVIARDRGVDLRARPSRHRPQARSDRALLARIVGNLADNAIKYAEPVRSRRRVLVAVTALSDRVRITVIDNGVGIPEAKQDEVFKPFIQLGNPSRDSDKGLGLGLSIVAAGIKALSEHRIALRSVQGAGTRISIEAPRSRAVAATLGLATIDEPSIAEMSSLFVWLIETDVIARAATRSLLDACNILTEEAVNFKQLQHALSVSERRPDLIICGERPVDGRDATEVMALLFERWRGSVPMLVLVEGALPRGADPRSKDVLRLSKPVDPEDLLLAIRQLCFPLPLVAEAE